MTRRPRRRGLGPARTPDTCLPAADRGHRRRRRRLARRQSSSRSQTGHGTVRAFLRAFAPACRIGRVWHSGRSERWRRALRVVGVAARSGPALDEVAGEQQRAGEGRELRGPPRTRWRPAHRGHGGDLRGATRVVGPTAPTGARPRGCRRVFGVARRGPSRGDGVPRPASRNHRARQHPAALPFASDRRRRATTTARATGAKSTPSPTAAAQRWRDCSAPTSAATTRSCRAGRLPLRRARRRQRPMLPRL